MKDPVVSGAFMGYRSFLAWPLWPAGKAKQVILCLGCKVQ